MLACLLMAASPLPTMPCCLGPTGECGTVEEADLHRRGKKEKRTNRSLGTTEEAGELSVPADATHFPSQKIRALIR